MLTQEALEQCWPLLGHHEHRVILKGVMPVYRLILQKGCDHD